MNLTLQTFGPGYASVLKTDDPANLLPAEALYVTGLPITVNPSGNANILPGTYHVTQISDTYAVFDAPIVSDGSATVTGISVTIPDFVTVTGAVGSAVITQDNQIQVPAPTLDVSHATGTVQMRLRLASSMNDTNFTNGPWVDFSTQNLVLSMAIPNQYQNTGENVPVYVVQVKDNVADWPACGWLIQYGYNCARFNDDQSSYGFFYAPVQNPLNDAQILALLPLARLTGKRITIVLVGDSISAGPSNTFAASYQAYLDSLWPGKFLVVDGGVSGAASLNWLPNAVNVHRNSTTNENFYTFALHRAQEAAAAGDIVVFNYFLGTNRDADEVADDPTIVNGLKAALPNAYFLIHPCRTFLRGQFRVNDGGLYKQVSDAQRALASASSSDNIYPGTEKHYPVFLTHQNLIDAFIVHPQPGGGVAVQCQLWAESTALLLAAVLPFPSVAFTADHAQTLSDLKAILETSGGVVRLKSGALVLVGDVVWNYATPDDQGQTPIGETVALGAGWAQAANGNAATLLAKFPQLTMDKINGAQQAGSQVTLPASPPSGYGGGMTSDQSNKLSDLWNRLSVNRANLLDLLTPIKTGIDAVLSMTEVVNSVRRFLAVYSSFESDAVAKTGVVPLPKKGEQELGGHAVCVVGYDSVKKTFTMRNSWGSGWGQAGHFTVPFAYLTSATLASDVWTIRAGK